MIDFNYSKFKERAPEQTVERVKKILSDLDIKTKETWMDSGVEGCYAVRVSLEDTGSGANGKGTNKEYCLASGYAELLERLQPDFVYLGEHSPEVMAYAGFERFPDETRPTAKELAEEDNAFTRLLFDKFSCFTPYMKEALMKSFIEAIGYGDTLASVPFVSVKNGATEQLPWGIICGFYGSNGMCAGNTPEEALVQGFAELFERHAAKKILVENVVPPDVPREYLQKFPPLYALIEKIESGGRYRVTVKDCSMGGQYPVVAVIIADSERGSFGFKMASHPSFSIALERTFTEAMQGKTLETFTYTNSVAGRQAVVYQENLVNTIKTGHGCFNPELFSADFSYPFTEFRDVSGLSNRELLADMAGILLKQGYDILVRDFSYLGFNSYFIVVPGFSEMYEIGPMTLKSIGTMNGMQKDWPFSSEEARDRLIKYIKFKRISLLENEPPFYLKRPVGKCFPGGALDTELLLLAALFDKGLDDEALSVASNAAASAQRHGLKDEAVFFECATRFLFLGKLSVKDVKRVLNALYKKETVDRVVEIFENPREEGGALKVVLPPFNCWDCENCAVSGQCDYPELAVLAKKLKKARKESGLTQDGLLELLKGIAP